MRIYLDCNYAMATMKKVIIGPGAIPNTVLAKEPTQMRVTPVIYGHKIHLILIAHTITI